MDTVESLFVSTAAAKLRLFVDRIGICLAKLTEDQIWARGHENENAAGNLVLHLNGNVRQWVLSGLGGQADVRKRDEEFDTQGGLSQEALMSLIRGTVGEAVRVIEGLTAEQLTRVYQIQTRTVTGIEAVFNVVYHFAEHTGQIIFITKNLTEEDLAFFMPRTRKA